MAIFHKGLYDDFAASDFQDEVIAYRNSVKELFVEQVVRKGTDLVKRLN